jgi:hypothetical protein
MTDMIPKSEALIFAHAYIDVAKMVSEQSAFHLQAGTSPCQALDKYLRACERCGLTPHNDAWLAVAHRVVRDLERRRAEAMQAILRRQSNEDRPMYVIRSMSATDWRPGCASVPYHIYLLPPGKRHGAYWTRIVTDAMRFDTEAEAEAEWLRFWPADRLGTQDIAPVNCPTPIWERTQHRPTKGVTS